MLCLKETERQNVTLVRSGTRLPEELNINDFLKIKFYTFIRPLCLAISSFSLIWISIFLYRKIISVIISFIWIIMWWLVTWKTFIKHLKWQSVNNNTKHIINLNYLILLAVVAVEHSLSGLNAAFGGAANGCMMEKEQRGKLERIKWKASKKRVKRDEWAVMKKKGTKNDESKVKKQLAAVRWPPPLHWWGTGNGKSET